jgi:hypothetical protein
MLHDSSVNTSTRLRVDEQEESGFDSRQEQEIFLFSMESRLTLGPHVSHLLRERQFHHD